MAARNSGTRMVWHVSARPFSWPSPLYLTFRKWVKPAMVANTCDVRCCWAELAARGLLSSDALTPPGFAELSGRTGGRRW
jgi:hypothetical protein